MCTHSEFYLGIFCLGKLPPCPPPPPPLDRTLALALGHRDIHVQRTYLYLSDILIYIQTKNYFTGIMFNVTIIISNVPNDGNITCRSVMPAICITYHYLS